MFEVKQRLAVESQACNRYFDENFTDVLSGWCNVTEFIWDVQENWFKANWRVKVNPASKDGEAIFLLLHNARVDVVAGIHSFDEGFIRGSALSVKASLEKICAAIVFSKDLDRLKSFFGGDTIDSAWVDEVGKSYPEIRDLYNFIEKNYTHDPFMGFAGPFLIRDCDIDRHVISPSVDHFLGVRWGVIYLIQSCLLILAQFSDLFFHRGTNMWSFEEAGVRMIETNFHKDLENVQKLWAEANEILEKKYPGSAKVLNI